MLPSSSPVVVIVPQARLHVAFWMIQALEPSLERAGVEIHQQASRAARDHLFSNPIPSSWCSAMISKGARSAPRELKHIPSHGNTSPCRLNSCDR
jgi:hypothetical protein